MSSADHFDRLEQELRTAKAASAASAAAATAEIVALKAQVAALQAAVEEQEENEDRVDWLEGKLDAMRQEVEEMLDKEDAAKNAAAALQRRCDEQAETITTMGQTIEGLRAGLDETAAAKLRFSDDFAAALQRADAAEREAETLRAALAEKTRYVASMNDSLWGYGSGIAALRRQLAQSEPHRRIAELEEQVAALRRECDSAMEGRYYEMGQTNKWMARAYAAEKPAVGATEVHDLREQLVAQAELIRERDEARAAAASAKAAAAEYRQDMVHWMSHREAAEKVIKEMRAEMEALRADRDTLVGDVASLRERASAAAEESGHDVWRERYKDQRRLAAETVAAVEQALEDMLSAEAIRDILAALK